jgi:hypothetical protein
MMPKKLVRMAGKRAVENIHPSCQPPCPKQHVKIFIAPCGIAEKNKYIYIDGEKKQKNLLVFNLVSIS